MVRSSVLPWVLTALIAKGPTEEPVQSWVLQCGGIAQLMTQSSDVLETPANPFRQYLYTRLSFTRSHILAI
jgi:hypothetical protein